MKKWMMFFASLILLVMSVGTPKSYARDKLTSATFDSVKIYYGMGEQVSPQEPYMSLC